MRVLVACEYSGIVTKAFLDKGHDAMSCDILPTESDVPHYQGDVIDIINDGYDLMVAHPPCTFMCNSGVRWLWDGEQPNQERWENLSKGAEFFKRLWNAPIEKKCFENPVMHKYAQSMIGHQPTQLIQPWMFGVPETKAICFWLDGLPPLIPTHFDDDLFSEPIPDVIEHKVHRMAPSPERSKLRSRFFEPIAEAMADQWGEL